MIRNLCGPQSCASIALADFGKDFRLTPLIHSTAILSDENDVGTFIDAAANVKAIVTQDTIAINRKHKDVVSYKFYGFMIQCLNEFPRVRDKSDSFSRRQLFVPFDKCFTGAERKYIKSDYLYRPEVLEYVLYKVLNMNYYELSEPDACRLMLNEYKEYNNPVHQFWNEMSPRFVWDLLPFTFLYALYTAWFKMNEPSGKPQGRNSFITSLLDIINGSTEWYCESKSKNIKSAGKMDKPELLIVEYNLEQWKNPLCTNKDLNRLCLPPLSATYRGIRRFTAGSNTDDTDDND